MSLYSKSLVFNKVCQTETKGMYYDAENKDSYLPSKAYGIYRKIFGRDIFHKVRPINTWLKESKFKYTPRDENKKEAIKFCLGNA